MIRLPTLRTIQLVATAVVLGACSPGGGSGGGIGGTGVNDPNVTDTELRETDLSLGRITGFGSVIIGGTTFNTDTADIVVSGVPANESSLRVGMTVSAAVNFAQQTASRIEYLPQVIGPVESVELAEPADNANGRFQILGRSIRFTDSVVLDGLSAEDIAEGVVLEVSGTVDASDTLSASYVRLHSSGTSTYLVQGAAMPGPSGFFIGFSGFNFQLLGINLDTGFPFVEQQPVLISLPADSVLPQFGNFVYAAPRFELTQNQTVEVDDHIVDMPSTGLLTIARGITVLLDENTNLSFASGDGASPEDFFVNSRIRLNGTVLITDTLVQAVSIVVLE